MLRYDIAVPLVYGRVPIEGVKLVPTNRALNGTVIGKDSPILTGDFGLVDLNWGSLLPLIELGAPVTALPVFSKRKPVYQYVFVRSDSGINSPKDLEGRRVWCSLTGSCIGM